MTNFHDKCVKHLANIITSEARFRQRILKYSLKHGVTKASIRFRRSSQAIYEWRAKYDGKRLEKPELKKRLKRQNKPCMRAEYHPGQKVQICAVIFFGSLKLTVSKLAANHNTAASKTEAEASNEIFHDIGNGIGGNRITTKMSHKTCEHCKAYAPNDLIAEYGRCVFPKITAQYFIGVQYVAKTELDSVFF